MAGLRIGELLVQEGFITATQLEAALAAQQIFGGRLGTNLVEQGFVSEVDLARLLSKQLNIRMVQPDALAHVDREVLDLIPADIARKYAVVPFAHDPATDRIALAMADPLNLQKIDEIQFALGKRVDFHICPEVMLGFALEKYYGVARVRRYIRLSGVADGDLQVFPTERAGRTATAGRGERRALFASGAGRPSNEAMLAAVVEAPTKQDLIAGVTQVLAAFGRQVVFFALRGSELMAWEAHGIPLGVDELRSVILPLGEAAVLHQVVEDCGHRLVPALDPATHGTLEGILTVDCSGPVFVLPLIVNRKVFGIFVLAGLDEQALAADTPLLVELMKRVACKLQIFFLATYLSAPL